MIGRIVRLGRALRGRSAHELRTRVAQLVAARAEARGVGGLLDLTDASLARALAPGAPRDPAGLHAAFRAPGRPRFFGGPGNAVGTAGAVAARCPGHVAATVARADRVLAGRFDLLGHSDLDYGNPIDWQREPVAGLSAPLVHWSRVPYLDPAVVGDHKVVWELNRQQYLVTLAQAWAYTGDRRYGAAAAAHIDSWIAANPPSKVGINWASSLEVAFRAMSWLWALHLLRDSDAIGPELHGRMLGMLHVHGRHLESYLSTYFSPNTHLTGEALGLAYLGILLPELRLAARWRAMGVGVLETHLGRHVRPDGVYFEQASQYHRYTTEFYLHLHLLGEANGVALSPAVRPALGALFDHLLHLARPDGTIPLLGDDDGGRLVQLDDRLPADVRALLATGAVVLGRGDLAHASGGDLAAMGWLLGAGGLERFDAIPAAPPAGLARAFPDGGFYTVRDGWTGDAAWAVIDCGPHGTMNCGHAHADALSLELAVDGRPLLVESGTYSYPGPERNSFRATAAHNAVTVDGASSSEPSTPFQWHRVADCRAERWITEPRFTAFAGSHDGFATLPVPAGYRREILVLHGDYLVVRDIVDGAGDHDVAVHWHAAPGLEIAVPRPSADDRGAALAELGDAGAPVLHMAVVADGGALERRAGWVSPTYGRREPAAELVFRQRAAGRVEIVTCLLPWRGGASPPSMRAVARFAGGRGLILDRADGGEDWLLLGSGDVLLEWEDVRTDAGWLWLRRDGDGAVREFVALDVGRAEVAGAALVAAGERRPWCGGAGTSAGGHDRASRTNIGVAEE